MVIYKDQLKKLLEFRERAREHLVVSLYLNVTPPRPFLSELRSLLHARRVQLHEHAHENDLPKAEIRAVEELFDRIEARVEEIERGLERTRLLVIFADPEGFWQEYRLPVALPSRLVVEPDPYVRPLTVLLDEFDRYCVVVTDARKARLFSLYLGDFEEHPDVFVEDDVPDRVSASRSVTRAAGSGVWGGLGDLRVQRHIEDHVHRHLKRVADLAFRFYQETGFDRLILGGPEDKVLPWLKDHLHSYLQQRLAGEFHARPEWNEAKLKELALEVAQRWERRCEEELIERLLEQAKPGGKGVLGLEPTLEALMLGQVHTLVVQNEFRAQGTLCRNDHYLSTYLEKCPLCDGEMEPVEDLVDEMVEEAIAQGAEVEHVFTDHEGFTEHGVGALLRFTL